MGVKGETAKTDVPSLQGLYIFENRIKKHPRRVLALLFDFFFAASGIKTQQGGDNHPCCVKT